MDCVSCDKCRLNGKLQVRGLATTLKLLFLPESMRAETINRLQDAEIVSLLQLLNRLSESINILEKFRVEEDIEASKCMVYRRVFAFVCAAMVTVTALIVCGKGD
jgi:ERO1-like protein beta